jgi:hypothetical protein
MSTVYFTGFEAGDASEAQSTSGTFSVQSAVTNGNSYALRVNPTNNIGYYKVGAPLSSGAQGVAANVVTSYFRFYFLWKVASVLTEIFLCTSVTPFNTKCRVRLNSSNKLVFYNTAPSIVGTTTTVLSSNTWYRIELKVGTGATAAWALNLALGDAASFLETISGTSDLGSTNAGSCLVGNGEDNVTIDHYFDDFLWSDSAYPGAGRCVCLLPNANGTNQTWSIGAGSGVNHYDKVNERPPDGDTSYLLSPLVLNDLESEVLQTRAQAGIAVKSVNCVKSVAILKQNVSGGTARVLLRSNGTADVTSADYTATGTYTAIQKLYDTDPATSSAWTPAGLDTLESGAKDTSAVNQVRMTFTAVMVDYVPPQNLSVTASDSPSTTDSAARTGAFTRTGADSPLTADSAARLLALLRSASDSPQTTDSLARTGTFGRSTADSPQTTDSAFRTLALVRSGTDAPSTADAATRLLALLRSLADSPVTTDSPAASTTHPRTASDSPSTTDSTTRLLALLRTASDSPGSTDAASRLLVLARTASDSPLTADIVARVTALLRTAGDSPSTADAATRLLALARTASDDPASTDLATRLIVLVRSASDSPSTADTVARALLLLRTAVDSPTSTDASSRLVAAFRQVQDSPSTSDALVASLALLRACNDLPATTDSVTRVLTLLRTALDSPATSDSLTRTLSLLRSLADNPVTLDSVAASRAVSRTGSDSPLTADSAVTSASIVRSASDAPATGDSVARLLTLARTVTDSPHTVDSVRASLVLAIFAAIVDQIAVIGHVADSFTIFSRLVDEFLLSSPVQQVSSTQFEVIVDTVIVKTRAPDRSDL